MRFVLVALLAMFGAGCAANKTTGVNRSDATAPSHTSTASPATVSKPTVTADGGLSGRIVSVNSVLRFVVIDFPLLKMPALEQRLSVYRQGQKVGEVKITGPMQDTTIAGDITTGEAQWGDEVREH